MSPDQRRARVARRRHGASPVETERRRLLLAASAFIAVLTAGWVGYQVVEDVGPLDSLYMTVITITTVGFREVVIPSAGGKILTMFVIAGGVLTVTYAGFTAAAFVVEGHLATYLEVRAMDRAISEMDRHIIVCGFGRVGRHLASTLEGDGAGFVVVDSDEDKADEARALGYLVVHGDASEEHVLLDAGIERARGVVAAVNTDADNVLTTLTAKGLNADCTVIARVKVDENEHKLHRAGADRVISPSTIGGRRIAQILTRPTVADFLDGIAGGAVDYNLEEVAVTSGSDLSGVSLREAAIRERFGCTVVALRHVGDATLDSHPSPNTPLAVGDVLVVMGSQADVTAMRQLVQG